ncbi:MAG TPA: chlorite dismutase family protein [Chloroflexia bacterium]
MEPTGETTPANQPMFVSYTFFKTDPAWRRLPAGERDRGRAEFRTAVDRAGGVTTYAYSTVGLKADADLLLWRSSPTLDALQESMAALLQTGLGSYTTITRTMFGMTRPSHYTKRRTVQEQAVGLKERERYLVVYPFVKTIGWYLMSQEARQGMMNEHIRVGHEFPGVRQVLLYSTGLDDQEFIVVYEMADLAEFQALVIALRDTEARRYTERDTPIATAIHRPLDEALALLG